MKYITIVLSITLLGIATAWASKPEIGSYTFYYDSCPDPGPLYDCGEGFFICEVVDFDGVTMMFLDKNGDLVRYVDKATGEGGLYELGNPDNFLPYKKVHQTFEYDVAKDMSSMTGPVGLIVVPGQGLIFQSVGRITTEGLGVFPPYVKEAGNHDWYHAFGLGEVNQDVCDYIASH